jgi:hypothetical protein
MAGWLVMTDRGGGVQRVSSAPADLCGLQGYWMRQAWPAASAFCRRTASAFASGAVPNCRYVVPSAIFSLMQLQYLSI